MCVGKIGARSHQYAGFIVAITNKSIKDTILALPPNTQKKISDGRGLHLLIRPDGSGRWGYSYRYEGKQKTYYIGKFPEIQPHKARELLQDARSQVALGNDPASMKSEEKANVRRKAAAEKVIAATGQSPTTFRHIAEIWLKTDHAISAPASWETNRERLKSHVYPRWAGRELVTITKADILALTDHLDASDLSPTADKILPLIRSILTYAEDRAELLGLPKGYISPAHTLKRRSRHKTVHHPAITDDPERLASLIHAIREYGLTHGRAVTRYALELSLLLFMRPGEIRSMEWDQIDFETGLHTFTPLKTAPTADPRPIVTGLSRQALRLFMELREITGDGKYVFSGRGKEGYMSEATVGNALKRLGYEGEMTAHGFRATARTMIREKVKSSEYDTAMEAYDLDPVLRAIISKWLKTPIEIIEFQLSHSIPDIHGRAYNRAEYLDERTKMMQAWADYLDEISLRYEGRTPSKTLS